MMQTVQRWGGKVGNKVAIRMSVSRREGEGGMAREEEEEEEKKRKRRRTAVLTLEEKAGEGGQQEPQ